MTISSLLRYGARRAVDAFEFVSGFSILPRDRILSAVSEDGLEWTREDGVRIDAGFALMVAVDASMERNLAVRHRTGACR